MKFRSRLIDHLDNYAGFCLCRYSERINNVRKYMVRWLING